MLLEALSVLLIDDDLESLEVLAAHLEAQGARSRVANSVAEASRALAECRPDALVSELILPDVHGPSFLRALRSAPGCAELPAIALSTHRRLAVEAQALESGFEKYLVKPSRLTDVADALCSVAGDRQVPPAGTQISLDALGQGLSQHDYRWVLGVLNASTAHRYSGLFRFDEGELTSVWTFDRERPLVDPFPLETKLSDTPCAALRARPEALTIVDIELDERFRAAPRENRMRSFLGVPLLGWHGGPFGALCHFDAHARPGDPRALELLERSALMFRFVGDKPTTRRPPPS
jgi:CheY-like chemotaxis protein